MYRATEIHVQWFYMVRYGISKVTTMAHVQNSTFLCHDISGQQHLILQYHHSTFWELVIVTAVKS